MHPHPVSEQTRLALAQAEALLRRDCALAQLVAAMDPGDRAVPDCPRSARRLWGLLVDLGL